MCWGEDSHESETVTSCAEWDPKSDAKSKVTQDAFWVLSIRFLKQKVWHFKTLWVLFKLYINKDYGWNYIFILTVILQICILDKHNEIRDSESDPA